MVSTKITINGGMPDTSRDSSITTLPKHPHHAHIYKHNHTIMDTVGLSVPEWTDEQKGLYQHHQWWIMSTTRRHGMNIIRFFSALETLATILQPQQQLKQTLAPDLEKFAHRFDNRAAGLREWMSSDFLQNNSKTRRRSTILQRDLESILIPVLLGKYQSKDHSRFVTRMCIDHYIRIQWKPRTCRNRLLIPPNGKRTASDRPATVIITHGLFAGVTSLISKQSNRASSI